MIKLKLASLQTYKDAPYLPHVGEFPVGYCEYFGERWPF